MKLRTLFQNAGQKAGQLVQIVRSVNRLLFRAIQTLVNESPLGCAVEIKRNRPPDSADRFDVHVSSLVNYYFRSLPSRIDNGCPSDQELIHNFAVRMTATFC